jgi:cell division protein FtsI (penicillin-binding protein 3)/stage V sporulation protein D (sporulation-specific penicillin-binding protein)
LTLIIVGKLYWLQIVEGNTYREKAEKQYSKISDSVSDRGSIFFESKDSTKIAAATMKEGYTIAINPKLIKNISNTYEALIPYIKIDKTIFNEKASKLDDPYEEIVKRLDKSIGESIQELKLPGIITTKENWRVYPGDSLAANTIGLIGFNENNNIAGRYGLESYYEKVLSRNQQKKYKNIFAEIFSDIKGSPSESLTKEGDILTLIEPSVENFLDKTLADTKEKWSSDSIGGIIMNPNTGEIFAISSQPTFNPNNLKNIKDPRIFSNPIVEDAREMGSIIKPLTIAVGIDSGVITAQSTYNDTGFLELDKRKISNYDGRARGIILIQEVLSQSLNIGAATIALKSGHETFSKYFKSFGFGEITGIDQPNEQKGLVKNLDSTRDIEIATASYGQGIAMTPIQTIRALSTIANGGKLIIPHLVKRVEYTDGTFETINTINTQILKKETTDEVTRMLVKVVDKSLKNGELKMEHYSIAAKTGTAQIADHVNGGYYKDRYLHSFFGYFPAYNPKFIVFLYHIYPKNVEYASETLTDPFIQIAKFLINYYEIPPDR